MMTSSPATNTSSSANTPSASSAAAPPNSTNVKETKDAANSNSNSNNSDAIARLTGLTLNPETPLHMQPQQQQHYQQQQYYGGAGAAAAAAAAYPQQHYHHQQLQQQQPHIIPDMVAAASGVAVSSDPSDVTIRSLVSTKEAGVVIGKGGKNVATIREETGVKAGVSKVIQGIHERILSVSGKLDSVAKAYSIIARHLVETPSVSPSSHPHFQQSPECAVIRLLVAHQLMGSIIGKGGAKIREIQETSAAKIVVSKEMLPQSTERVIEIFGSADSVLVAVKLVGECIVHDGERAAGAILYNPEVRLVGSHRNERIVGGGPARPSNSTFYYTNSSAFTPRSAAAAGGNGRPISGNYGNPSRNHHNNNNNQHHHQQHNSNNNNNNTDSTVNTATNANINSADYETRSVPIPAAMVGCIIGRRGIFINQIRMESGSRISISKTTDPVTSQRIFTVMGTPESNEKALAMLYKQLDSERERFNEAGEQAGGDQDGEVVDEE